MTGRQIIEAIAQCRDIDIEFPVTFLHRGIDNEVIDKERMRMFFTNGELFVEETVLRDVILNAN